jgi:hypothetical protein
MLVTVHQPEHLPWLGLLAKVAAADLWIVLDDVAYRKNYFQNRNRVVLSGEPVWVTVPVHAPHGTSIAEVTVTDSPEWRRKYTGRLLQAYGKAPFADALQPALEVIGAADAGSSLADLNMALFTWLADAFEVRTPVVRSSSLGLPGAKSELLVHLCQEVGASTYLAGPSGRDYLDRSLFDAVHIDVRYFDFRHPTYAQQAPVFLAAMSAVDALANVGSGSPCLLAPSSWELAET